MIIREALEDRERATLSQYAMLASESKGRVKQEQEHDYRTAFQRDRDRILHCKAFRRLKGKTQVFLAPKGDHYRTRLTHTLEVSQIARTAARALFLNEDLTEAIALGHDLGHTPFGHAGEAALNEIYREGFRHFEQSLRVVEHLESTRRGRGLNLTHEVRDGIYLHSKGKSLLLGHTGEMASTLEGRIVSLCDAIAYINHDIDDAVRAGVITLDQLPQDALNTLGRSPSERIDSMVIGLIEASQEGEVGILEEVREAINALRDFLYTELYPSESINVKIRKASKLLQELYGYLMEQPDDLVPEIVPGDPLDRRVVDFLAGMTDHYALRLYEDLFFPESWPV